MTCRASATAREESARIEYDDTQGSEVPARRAYDGRDTADIAADARAQGAFGRVPFASVGHEPAETRVTSAIAAHNSATEGHIPDTIRYNSANIGQERASVVDKPAILDDVAAIIGHMSAGVGSTSAMVRRAVCHHEARACQCG